MKNINDYKPAGAAPSSLVKRKSINDYKPACKIDRRHLLTLKDYRESDIFEILHLAKKLKQMQYDGLPHNYLSGKTVAMIFAKSSTRTRVSFEMGIRQMGGYPMILNASDIQLNKSETIEDTAKILSGFFIDGVMIRTFKQSDVEALAEYGKFNVINGLTDLCHPCQALSDLFTIWEHFGYLRGLKLVFLGDGNNVANSLMLACSTVGIDFSIACPNSLKPDDSFVAEASRRNAVVVSHDIDKCCKDADIVYTDIFLSMGQEGDNAKYKMIKPFMVTADVMKKAKPAAVFMHCLPAHRDEEVSAEVIDGAKSIVFRQAENRLHTQKAIMTLLFKNK